jgi:hypothetical protein
MFAIIIVFLTTSNQVYRTSHMYNKSIIPKINLIKEHVEKYLIEY